MVRVCLNKQHDFPVDVTTLSAPERVFICPGCGLETREPIPAMVELNAQWIAALGGETE